MQLKKLFFFIGIFDGIYDVTSAGFTSSSVGFEWDSGAPATREVIKTI